MAATDAKLKVVFMGTPEFAVPSLLALADSCDVAGVVTRGDAVRRRGKQAEPSPVARVADEAHIPCVKTSRIDAEVLAWVQETAPDVICVAAYGCILPDEVLAVPRLDCVNVHASLLPRWRGAAPIQRAILAGDAEVGVSIMRVVHELDVGPFCRQASCAVAAKSATELTDELAGLGAQELVAALDDIAAGCARWQEQDEEQVSYAHKITKRELWLDPAASALDNLRRVQASDASAPARCEVAGTTLRVLEARPTVAVSLRSGEIAEVGGSLVLGAADGTFEVVRLQPDGKRAMEATAFVRGLRNPELSWAALARG